MPKNLKIGFAMRPAPSKRDQHPDMHTSKCPGGNSLGGDVPEILILATVLEILALKVILGLCVDFLLWRFVYKNSSDGQTDHNFVDLSMMKPAISRPKHGLFSPFKALYRMKLCKEEDKSIQNWI